MMMKKIATTVLAGLAMAGLPAVNAAASEAKTSAQILAPSYPAGLHQLRNSWSNKCMNIPGGSLADRAPVTQFTCGSWSDHYWNIDEAGNGFYRIRNFKSGKCLAVPGGTMERGVQLIQFPCGPWEDHFWRFVRESDVTFQIVNKKSGQCVAVRGGDWADNAPVIQWPCGDFRDHFWTVL